MESQQTRAAALNLVTAAMNLFNRRYLGRAVGGSPIDRVMLSRLSPLDWDRINLTGDYVWSD
ncbi:Tn3 family transposase [Sphingomonas sp. KC8]|uniref:Tn3 family transposase n=1 Tax=Sphingomonas sp. KC8 TaxID=1030157 RepID=UPI001E4B7EB5|nr:Tn3 family transposase [Sphingomonas sp. KC8]